MKKAIFRFGLMLALAFLALAQYVQAQEPVVANIPFAFTAGKMVLPAGAYRIDASRNGSLILRIQRTDHSAASYVISNAVEAKAPQTSSKLVFHRYGSRYFLTQIWTEGNNRGRELMKSAQEKEALLASNETPVEVTIVASLASPKP